MLYLTLRLMTGERFFPVLLVNIFQYPVLLVSVVLLPIALLAGNYIQALLLLPFMLIFALKYGAALIRRCDGKHKPAGAIRIVTYNAANFDTRGDTILKFIQSHNADIIAVVELTAENAAKLKQHCSDEYPYQLSVADDVQGKGLLSKYPITHSEFFYMLTNRPNIEATLNIEGQDVQVYVVHPPSPDFERHWNFYRPNPNNSAEVEQLLERTSDDMPTILLGDFNSTDQSATYRLVRQTGFTDTFWQRGCGTGISYRVHGVVRTRQGRRMRVNLPITRIDYIWHSEEFRTLQAYTGDPLTSDHMPLIADIKFRDAD